MGSATSLSALSTYGKIAPGPRAQLSGSSHLASTAPPQSRPPWLAGVSSQTTSFVIGVSQVPESTEGQG